MRRLPCSPSHEALMSGAYSDLRKVARSLALASLFDQPAERDMICDLLHLGLELEKIKEIASEPMLAMIRMQWWADLFTSETGPTEAADFAKRLYHHKDLSNDDVLAVIQQTQDSLQSPQAYVAWPQIFHLIVKANGWQIEAQITQTLGQNFAKFYLKSRMLNFFTHDLFKHKLQVMINQTIHIRSLSHLLFEKYVDQNLQLDIVKFEKCTNFL